MGDIGLPELLIILAIMLIVFGPGRIAGLGKALGESIRAFRTGLHPEHEDAVQPSASNQTGEVTH